MTMKHIKRFVTLVSIFQFYHSSFANKVMENAAITEAQLDYCRTTWIPEWISMKNGTNIPQKVSHEELFTESFDINGDQIPDILITDIFRHNGKAGFDWSLYVSTTNSLYNRQEGSCFHRIGHGAFVDEKGAIFSVWSDSAQSGSIQRHKWNNRIWDTATVARFKKNDDYKTVVTTDTGISYIVEDEDGLMGKLKQIFVNPTSKTEIASQLSPPVPTKQEVESKGALLPEPSQSLQTKQTPAKEVLGNKELSNLPDVTNEPLPAEKLSIFQQALLPTVGLFLITSAVVILLRKKMSTQMKKR